MGEEREDRVLGHAADGQRREPVTGVTALAVALLHPARRAGLQFREGRSLMDIPIRDARSPVMMIERWTAAERGAGDGPGSMLIRVAPYAGVRAVPGRWRGAGPGPRPGCSLQPGSLWAGRGLFWPPGTPGGCTVYTPPRVA